MSDSNGKRNRNRNNANYAPLSTDGDGPYSQESLIKMNNRFVERVERVERAFQTGSERRQSAAMNGANASRPL